MYGPLVEQGIWRTNKELRGLYKDTDKVADIKRERLEWTRYVLRMDQGSAVKKISGSKPVGSRRKGRPRLRWLEEVEKDVSEVKGEWRQEAVDREEWASVIEGASALRVPYSQAVSTQIKKNEMGGACSTYGKWRDAYRILVGKPEGGDHLDDAGADGRIMVKLIFKKWDGGHGLD